MSGYVTDEVVENINSLILAKKEKYRETAERNYTLAARYFSYEVLRRKLRSILVNFEGIVEAIGSHRDQ